jgi:3-methyl-2-oxobutanoate hydroxymethyltransferase
VPDRVAAHVTKRLKIPTIGIGAGPDTSGQVLVLHDVLGLYDQLAPRFAKRYAELGAAVSEAVGRYGEDVRARRFPGPEHAYSISDEEWDRFLGAHGSKGPVRLRVAKG